MSAVVELIYGCGTVTHVDWQSWRTENGELSLITEGRYGAPVVAATFAANQWARVYLADTEPTVTTPPDPFSPGTAPIQPGQAF